MGRGDDVLEKDIKRSSLILVMNCRGQGFQTSVKWRKAGKSWATDAGPHRTALLSEVEKRGHSGYRPKGGR